MGMKDVTAAGVRRAVDEYEQLGREQFLLRYAFGPARSYFLHLDEAWYESKAIVGAAHGFDRPDLGPLRSSEFSGGAASVGALLARLGFGVEKRPPHHRVVGDDGAPVDATFEVVRQGELWAVTLHSRGGASGSATARNTEYAKGLKLILERLRGESGTVEVVSVDSDKAHQLAPPERRLDLAFPLKLDEYDLVALAGDIGSAQANVAREPGATGSGNRTRRIRIEASLPNQPSLTQLTAVLSGATAVRQRVFVLTWNPDRPAISEEEVRFQQAEESAGRAAAQRWSTGTRKSGIEPGDRVVLLRQHIERGIVKSGFATSQVTQHPHWGDSAADLANYVNVSWEAAVDTADRLPVEALKELSQSTNWDAIRGSGTELPEDDAAGVWEAWTEHVQLLRDASDALPGDEAELGNDLTQGHITEGSKKSVVVNRYERSPDGRRRCIEKHGCACAACGLDFSERYGPIGEDFIHVHHTVPLASIGESYGLDPETELVPVCPNCHAMLHRGVSTPRTVAELVALMASAVRSSA